ncbi:MAG: NTP transferase domain-containing protein [Bradymonadales bacterium]
MTLYNSEDFAWPCAVIVCAAGAGRRMGINKALARLANGQSFLDHISSCIRAAGLSTIYVVTGAQADEVIAAHPNAAQWVHNFAWNETSMMDSLRLALRRLPAQWAAIHWPVDCVGIEPDAIRALLRERQHCALLGHRGKWGHPVLLSPRAVRELVVCHKRYSRLNDYLATFATNVVCVEGGEAALNNVNVPLRTL